jgi:CHAT domain-containing protein
MGLVRWLHNVNGLPPLTLQLRPNKAWYVIPDYPYPDWQLPETAKERQYLVDKFNATPVEPQPNPVLQLLTAAGSFDLLHFACHGEAEQDNISRARVVLEGRIEGQNFVPAYLNASTIEQYARLRGPDGLQAIVVLNACQTGRLGYKLTGIGGFAQAFLRAGAGAFVGTLWSVGDIPARAFTEAFYDALQEGKSIAEATTAARAKARADGDATWLAYVVYAHPEAKLTLG